MNREIKLTRFGGQNLVTYIDREGSCWNYTITSDCTGLFPHRFDSSDLCKACEESRAKSTMQVLRQLRHQQFRESVSVRRRFSFFFFLYSLNKLGRRACKLKN